MNQNNAIYQFHSHRNAVLSTDVTVTERIPNGLETLAVTTPCRVELNENILAVIEDNFIELLSNKVPDALVLRFWNRLALQCGLESVVEEGLDHLINGVSLDFKGLIVRIFQLLVQILEDKAGPFDLIEVQCLSVVAELDSVDPDEVDLAPVPRSDGSNEVDLFLELSIGGVNEQVRKRLSAGSISLVVLGVHLINDGNGEVFDPVLNLLLSCRRDWVRELSRGLVEGTVEDDSRGGDTSSLSELCISGKTEEVVLSVLVGSRAEDWRGLRGVGGKEGKRDNPVGFLEVFNVLLSHVSDSREGLPMNMDL